MKNFGYFFITVFLVSFNFLSAQVNVSLLGQLDQIFGDMLPMEENMH